MQGTRGGGDSFCHMRCCCLELDVVTNAPLFFYLRQDVLTTSARDCALCFLQEGESELHLQFQSVQNTAH